VVGIETVDAIETGAPDREIAGARAPPDALTQPAQRSERQAHQGRKAIDPAARSLARPIYEAPGFWRKLFPQHFVGKRGRQQNAAAGDEPAARSQAAMRGDEIRPHDA